MIRRSIHSVLNEGRCLPDPLPNKMLGDWAQAGYGDAYRAYQPYYYAQGVANGAYPAGVGAGIGAGVGAGGVDQSTTTIGTQIKVRTGADWRLHARACACVCVLVRARSMMSVRSLGY
jgi:hypothetical protein